MFYTDKTGLEMNYCEGKTGEFVSIVQHLKSAGINLILRFAVFRSSPPAQGSGGRFICLYIDLMLRAAFSNICCPPPTVTCSVAELCRLLQQPLSAREKRKKMKARHQKCGEDSVDLTDPEGEPSPASPWFHTFIQMESSSSGEKTNHTLLLITLSMVQRKQNRHVLFLFLVHLLFLPQDQEREERHCFIFILPYIVRGVKRVFDTKAGMSHLPMDVAHVSIQHQ